MPAASHAVACPGRRLRLVIRRLTWHHAARRLTGEVVKAVPPILAALEKYFGSPYPYKKLDLLAVPEFWAGAMENAGAITYREEILVLDPKMVTPQQRHRLISTTAHELAHMWFGDLVTLRWWDDIWLNESFASWMGDKISQQVAHDIRNQYVIEYSPKNAAMDGSFRAIKVTAKAPGTTVRTRSGYYATPDSK